VEEAFQEKKETLVIAARERPKQKNKYLEGHCGSLGGAVRDGARTSGRDGVYW
jgi:hypothetical protein